MFEKDFMVNAGNLYVNHQKMEVKPFTSFSFSMLTEKIIDR